MSPFVAFLLCFLLDVADFLTFCALVVADAQTGMWFLELEFI